MALVAIAGLMELDNMHVLMHKVATKGWMTALNDNDLNVSAGLVYRVTKLLDLS